MLETFEAKKPFYPLISFSVSVIVLIFGMLFPKIFWLLLLPRQFLCFTQHSVFLKAHGK